MAPSVRIGRSIGATTITLAAGDLEATFVPSVGMLGTSLRYRGEEFLAMPGGVAAYHAGHQTGLPLLAPWANRLGSRGYRAAGRSVDLRRLPLTTDDSGLPIHGTMTAQPWEVVRLEATAAAAFLRARFDYGVPSLLEAFPFPHELIMDVALRHGTLVTKTSLRPT
jgi:aldose 1-epimerase